MRFGNPEKLNIIKEGARENKKKNEKKNQNGINRRKFLWQAGTVAAGLAAGANAIRLVTERSEKYINKKSEEEFMEPEATPEQEAIEEIDAQSISEIVDFNKEGRIEYNMKTVKAIEEWWKRKYREDLGYNKDFRNAYFEMGAWKEELIKAFTNEGYSEEEAAELIYLAIPESHWQVRAVSGKSAVGPYQFMKDTALDCKLIVKGNIDERQDPIRSAQGCACNLKYLQKEMGGDKNIALSGYNGSFVWDYRSKVFGEMKDKTRVEKLKALHYEDYIKFMEDIINEQRDKIKKDQFYFHIVEDGQTYSMIARKYDVETSDVEGLNSSIPAKELKPGMKIKVIEFNNDNRESFYNNLIKGYKENLVYPAKYNAVIALIKEGLAKEEKEKLECEEKPMKNLKADYSYIVRNNDKTIYGIAKQFEGISSDEIVAANPKIDPNTDIKPGAKLTIPGIMVKRNLVNLSKVENIPLEKLLYLNPAIKDKDEAIPYNYIIRIWR